MIQWDIIKKNKLLSGTFSDYEKQEIIEEDSDSPLLDGELDKKLDEYLRASRKFYSAMCERKDLADELEELGIDINYVAMKDIFAQSNYYWHEEEKRVLRIAEKFGLENDKDLFNKMGCFEGLYSDGDYTPMDLEIEQYIKEYIEEQEEN